jgi:microcystin synthetase protein McyA
MGNDKVTVNLEHHGRTPEVFAMDDLDVSRTIGWFTCLYPVCFDYHADLGRALKAVKAQLRQVPHQGLSYGLLRYVAGAEDLDAQPAVSFNYLGQFDALEAASEGFRLASTPVGPTRNEQGERAHLLDITSWVRQEQLHIEWTYSRHLHHHDTINALAQACLETLQRLIEHCRSVESAGYTPEDFNLVQLDQDTLETVLAQVYFQGEGPA